jgi:hypothetical protein
MEIGPLQALALYIIGGLITVFMFHLWAGPRRDEEEFPDPPLFLFWPFVVAFAATWLACQPIKWVGRAGDKLHKITKEQDQ